MPWSDIKEMPSYTKKYSTIVRRQAMHVFNTVYTKVLKETRNKKQAEKRAFMAMHSVLKKRFVKGQNASAESHSDYFHSLVDQFLGNLMG